MMRRQPYIRLPYLLFILAAELILWASLAALGWRATLATLYSVGLLAILFPCAVAGKTAFAQWWNRRFRYRLTHMMLGYSLLCGAVAMLGAFFGRSYFERYSMRALQQLGVDVDGSPGGTTNHSDEGLRDSDIRRVTFFDDATIDAATSHLRRLTNLETVTLSGSVTDVGLQRMTTIPFHRDIAMDLMSPSISDNGMQQIRDCPGIVAIFINGAQISSRGIGFLKSLGRLKRLGLIQEGAGRVTHVGDDEVSSIAGMDQLSSLVIVGPSVTDQSIATLGSLSRLDTLSLMDTQISDNGLSLLRSRLPSCWIQVQQNPKARIPDDGSAGQVPANQD